MWFYIYFMFGLWALGDEIDKVINKFRGVVNGKENE